MNTDPQDEAIARRVVEAYRTVRLDLPLSAIVSPAPPRRTPRILAVTAAAAATALIVALGWWVRPGADGTPPAGSPGPEATVSLRPTATVPPLTEQEVRDWLSSLPTGPGPEMLRMVEDAGSYALVGHGHRVRLPSEVTGSFSLIDTPAGGLAWLPTWQGSLERQISYLDLLEPSGRLVPLTQGALNGVTKDPSSRFVAWQETGATPQEATQVTVLELATRAVVTRAVVAADTELVGWSSSGLVFQQPSGLLVRTLTGQEHPYPGTVARVAGDHALLRDDDCLRILDLPTGRQGPRFACPSAQQRSSGAKGGQQTPFVELTHDGRWMLVDGVAVEVDSLATHDRLVPAGFPFPDTDPFLLALTPVGQTGLRISVVDPAGPVVGRVVCDLPTGHCEKVPEG